MKIRYTLGAGSNGGFPKFTASGSGLGFSKFKIQVWVMCSQIKKKRIMGMGFI
jgi:hypothetical protein